MLCSAAQLSLPKAAALGIPKTLEVVRCLEEERGKILAERLGEKSCSFFLVYVRFLRSAGVTWEPVHQQPLTQQVGGWPEGLRF